MDTFDQIEGFQTFPAGYITSFFSRNPNLRSKMLKSYRTSSHFRFQIFLLFYLLTRSGGYSVLYAVFLNTLSIFLVVSEVPVLYRKLREACGKHSWHNSSKSVIMVPSYEESEHMFFMFETYTLKS